MHFDAWLNKVWNPRTQIVHAWLHHQTWAVKQWVRLTLHTTARVLTTFPGTWLLKFNARIHMLERVNLRPTKFNRLLPMCWKIITGLVGKLFYVLFIILPLLDAIFTAPCGLLEPDTRYTIYGEWRGRWVTFYFILLVLIKFFQSHIFQWVSQQPEANN